MLSRRVALIAAVVCVLLMSILLAEPPSNPPLPGTRGTGRLPITISKETTYITEPLRPDGYPDYLAALNRLGSEGVTPENNAVVPLVQAFGPETIHNAQREKFFKMLGTASPPDRGDYYIEYEPYVRQHAPDALEDRSVGNEYRQPVAWEQYFRGELVPWSREDCPLLAGWMAENEKPLERMVEASKRSRFYIPAISHGEPEMGKYLNGAFMAQVQSVRNAARLLNFRAMLRLHERKAQEAWDDLQAIHRLGRLLGRARTVAEYQVGAAVDRFACEGDCTFAHFTRLTSERAAKYRAELRQLAPLPRAVDKATVSERFAYLDIICGCARGSVKPADAFPVLPPWIRVPVGGVDSNAIRDAFTRYLNSGAVDWNEALRLGNQQFDRMVEAADKHQPAERQKAAAELDKELEQQVARFGDAKLDLIEGTLDVFKGRTPQQIATQSVSAIFLVDTTRAENLQTIENQSIIYLRLNEIALRRRVSNRAWPVS